MWALLTGLLLPDAGRTAASARTTPVSNAGCSAGPGCKQQSAVPDVLQRQHACTCQEAKQGARFLAELCTILSTVSDVWGTRGSSCQYWRTCSTKHEHKLKHAKHTAGMLAKLLDALKHTADRQTISAKCQAQGKGLTGYRRVCSWENSGECAAETHCWSKVRVCGAARVNIPQALHTRVHRATAWCMAVRSTRRSSKRGQRCNVKRALQMGWHYIGP